MNRYRYLFWDLDQTIFDFKKCEINALKRTFQDHDIPFNDKIFYLYTKINNRLWRLHDESVMSQEDVLVNRFKELFIKLDITRDPVRISVDFQDSLTREVYFEKDALETLKKLYGRYELYIISNGNSTTQRKRIERANIQNFFKGIYISEELGCHKPEPEFFDKCLQLSRITEREKVLIIGDSLTSDMKGGVNSRIDTCWYNPCKSPNSLHLIISYEITDFAELVNLLENG